ncbi:MAG TPA: 2-amino-4-hydroxy-6-hydroxymethyldihydropteridine diphosphokinase [Armatimonadetes bacterium]|jgi:2-amino-4-hydroxy-6-hydroxymethyldihydropteridine diphosphokinase|nr:2-amino-4-hydroxy-6-hydroxymethyldihydropteridine diphosphokinase [Armatimonadota bacterium]
MARAYLGLGSNLGDRLAHLRSAIRILEERGIVTVRASHVYETAPVGPVRQQAFLNAVVEVETTLPPVGLLAFAAAVEKALGRERLQRWGPRTLDIDLLLYEDRRVDLPYLQIPHPRMHERRFVLLPLTELEPEIRIPGVGRARDCLAALDEAEQPATKREPLLHSGA